jgi:hypothetical protein
MLGLLGICLWLGLLVGPLRLATGLLDARDHLSATEEQLSDGLVTKARFEAFSAGAAVERARSGLDRGGPLLDLASYLPTVGDALKEADHFVAAAEHSAAAVSGTLEVAGGSLGGKDGLIAKDPNDPKKGSIIRLERLEELAVVVGDVRRELQASRSQLEAVKLANVPARVRGAVKDGIERAEKADELLVDAQAGFDILPAVLGAGGPRTYLLGFQNTAEQRGTGGALLQFREMTIEDGKPRFSNKGGTVYNLDKNRDPISIPLPEDAWYVAGIEDAQRFGNANWSPDWPLSAQLTVAYAEATPGSNISQIDGVFNIDPVALQKVMRGTGPFRTKARNRISSSKVVHFLLYKAYASFPIPSVRRVVLNQVVNGFYDRMLDPQQPTELIKGFGSALSTKHMQIWMANEAEQEFIERMGWDGGIEEAEGDDYVMVVEQNVGGNKLDYFDDQVNTMDIEIDGKDARVSTEMRVWNNVFLPQPRYSMGDSQSNAACQRSRCPTHKPMMNLYVQGDAELLSWDVEGDRLDTPAPAIWTDGIPPTHTERGKKVWSATLDIPPGEQGAFSLDYLVRDVVKAREGRQVYRLHVQHQPKVRPEGLVVRLKLPEGATEVKAPGWERDGDTIVWEEDLKRDMVLEVSWAE